MKKKITKGIKLKNFSRILKETPLDIRLLVSNSMMFVHLITELGYRENKGWEDSEDELLSKINRLAREHTDHQLKEIKEWEVDGKPTRIKRLWKKKVK